MLIAALLTCSGKIELTAQCTVNSSCLVYPLSQYVCLQSAPNPTVLLSSFIQPNGPLPAGGGFVNIIIDGNLVVDVDYIFDQNSHILLTPGSTMRLSNFPGTPPKLAIANSLVSSCNGLWAAISVTNDSRLELSDAVVTDGDFGISVAAGSSFSSKSTDYIYNTNFTASGPALRLGNSGGSIGQNINCTLVGNNFSGYPQALHILNTEPISVGAGNTFITPLNNPGATNIIGITIRNASVSFAPVNTFQGFYTAILDLNDANGAFFLNIEGGVFRKNTHVLRGSNPLPGGLPSTQGISLFVNGSLFEENREGLLVKIQNSGDLVFKENTFDRSGNTNNVYVGLNVSGDVPNSIIIKKNTMKNTIGSGAFEIRLPFWAAPSKKMIISENNLETTDHAIQVTLDGGGQIDDNQITVNNPNSIPFSGIFVTNTPKIGISRNSIVSNYGDGKVDGGIRLTSASAYLYCNSTNGNGASSGIVFREHCDGSVIRRNTMNNHSRGLSVTSLFGDGVVGEQVYKNNRWNGGTAAEAYMGSLLGMPILPQYFLSSQFIIQDNTSNLWPNPIVPIQPVSGGPLDWFYYDPANIDPELICLTPAEEEEDPSKKLTAFEQGLIDGTIEEIEGAEGKYRDIDFGIYYKLRNDPTLLTSENEGYFNTLNTPGFQKRYDITLGMESLSTMEEAILLGENTGELKEELELLTAHDDGENIPLRDALLEAVKETMTAIETASGTYSTSLMDQIDVIKSHVNTWIGEVDADKVLQEVLITYLNNFGIHFESYSIEDQEIIQNHAALCVVKYGKGVYLANAIAGTLQDYDLLSSCTPPAQGLAPGVEYGTAESVSSENLSIYPSPSTGLVQIQATDTPINSIRVINSLGKMVQQWGTMSGGPQELDLSRVTPGIYFIEIRYENGTRQTGKVAISR